MDWRSATASSGSGDADYCGGSDDFDLSTWSLAAALSVGLSGLISITREVASDHSSPNLPPFRTPLRDSALCVHNLSKSLLILISPSAATMVSVRQLVFTTLFMFGVASAAPADPFLGHGESRPFRYPAVAQRAKVSLVPRI